MLNINNHVYTYIYVNSKPHMVHFSQKVDQHQFQKKAAALARVVVLRLITGALFFGTGVPVYFLELTGVFNFLTLDGVLWTTLTFLMCGVACLTIFWGDTRFMPSGVAMDTLTLGVFWGALSGVFSMPCSGFLFGLKGEGLN